MEVRGGRRETWATAAWLLPCAATAAAAGQWVRSRGTGGTGRGPAVASREGAERQQRYGSMDPRRPVYRNASHSCRQPAGSSSSARRLHLTGGSGSGGGGVPGLKGSPPCGRRAAAPAVFHASRHLAAPAPAGSGGGEREQADGDFNSGNSGSPLTSRCVSSRENHSRKRLSSLALLALGLGCIVIACCCCCCTTIILP